MRRGCASELSEPRGLLYTQQVLTNGISGSKGTHGFAFISLRLLFPSPSSSTSVHKMLYSPFKTKMVAGYEWGSTSGGEGAGPQALTPEVVCVFKMATPYVTDETGGECGRREAASPRALGAGIRTWKGICAPPIPGPLPCPALRTAFPIHSPRQGVTCAPFWSRVWGGGLCFRSPIPWGPLLLVPAPGPKWVLRFFFSSWNSSISFGFSSLRASCTLSSLQFLPFPSPISAIPAFCSTVPPF